MFLHSVGNANTPAAYAWVHTLSPGDVRWTYYPAVFRIESGDWRSARSLLQECRQRHPNDGVVLAEYARLLSHLRDPSAPALYKELIEREYYRASAHSEYGMVLARANDQSGSVRELKLALALDPLDDRPNIALARIFAENGQTAEAKAAQISVSGRTLTTPLEENRYLDDLYWRFPKVNYLEGRAAFETAHGRAAEAIRLLERARSAAPPGDLSATLQLVYYMTWLNGPEQAGALLKDALSDPLTAPSAWFDYGLALQQRGQWREACQSYRAALAIEPDFSKALNGLGNCQEKSGHRLEALALYHRAAHDDKYAAQNLARLEEPRDPLARAVKVGRGE